MSGCDTPFFPLKFSFLKMLNICHESLREQQLLLTEEEIHELIAREYVEFRKKECAANKVATELVVNEFVEKHNEDMDKEKKERKAERKRRQRQRRKLKKQGEINPCIEDENNDNSSEKNQDDDDEEEEEDEEEIDVKSAFVSNAIGKVSNLQRSTKKDITEKFKDKKLEPKKDHPVTVLANIGFKNATNGFFTEAIINFSEALLLQPNDFRLYANRSLCFIQIQQYKKALEDAEKCTKYSPDYSKGYLCMGEAYLGLNDFQSAELAFERVLNLDPDCHEAINDLFYIQLKKLMDMGFSKRRATVALREKKTLNAAIDYLSEATNYEEDGQELDDDDDDDDDGGGGSEVYQSDEDDETFKSNSSCENGEGSQLLEIASGVSSVVESEFTSMRSNINPLKDFTNPYRCNRLYIGNLSSQITTLCLERVFSRFGIVTASKLVPASKCGFINFKDWRSAGSAMENLQCKSLMPGTPTVSIQYPLTDIQKLANHPLNFQNESKNGSHFTSQSNSSTDNLYPKISSSTASSSVSYSQVAARYSQKPDSTNRSRPIAKFNQDYTSCSRGQNFERNGWCSQTLPPSSPTPSLSSVRSCYSQADISRKPKHGHTGYTTNTCSSLYVWNLSRGVQNKDIISVFSKYGKIISVRIIPEKKCAFINFTNSNNAALAMSCLQGKSIFPNSPPIVIKYPANATSTGDSSRSFAAGKRKI